MNFALLPKHVEVEPIGEMTSDDALLFSLLAASELGWRLSNIGDRGFYAYPAYTTSSPVSVEVTIQIEEDKILVTSLSTSVFDIVSTSNRIRVREFLNAFRKVAQSTSHDEGTAKLKHLTEQKLLVSAQVDPLASVTKFNPLYFFTPREGYFITPILANLNIFLFAVMTAVGIDVIDPAFSDLMAWGGNYRAARVDGEWWRLITSIFVTNGLIQFTLNIYALITIGWMLEPMIGRVNLLVTYLCAAAISSVALLVWTEDGTIHTGAAPAILGVYGVFIALLSTNSIERANRPIVIVNTVVFMVFTFMAGLKPGMSNTGNVMGMVTGILIGYCLYPTLLQPDRMKERYITLSIITFVALASVTLAYRSLPGGDMAKYQLHIDEFAKLNKKATEVLDWPSQTDTKKMSAEIKSVSIPTLDQQIKILKKIEHLSIPDENKERARELIKYCIYRIKVYQLKLALMEGKSKNTLRDEYDISYYNVRIDAILEEFSSEFDLLTKPI